MHFHEKHRPPCVPGIFSVRPDTGDTGTYAPALLPEPMLSFVL
jgi:hypothetical protein